MSKIVVRIKHKATLPPDYDFVRVLHEVELPPHKRFTPARQPQVRPLYPNHFSVFAQAWQYLSQKCNPLLNPSNMTSVYNNRLWISNDHGFGDPDTPRRNFFKMEDLDADRDLAVESLTCGGNLLHVLGEIIFKTAAGRVPCYVVETLDRHVIPFLDELIERPWLITTATKLGGDGEPDRFPQGQTPGFTPGVRHPFVCDTRKYPIIVIEKWRCEKWEKDFAPDPYTVYSRYQSPVSLLMKWLMRL